MYVGPWQEYALSRKSVENPMSARARSDDFKREMEKALLAGLDPAAAAAALKAMEKVLETSTLPDTGSVNNDDNYSRSSHSTYHKPFRPKPKVVSSLSNNSHFKLSLPALDKGNPRNNNEKGYDMYLDDHYSGGGLTYNAAYQDDEVTTSARTTPNELRTLSPLSSQSEPNSNNQRQGRDGKSMNKKGINRVVVKNNKSNSSQASSNSSGASHSQSGVTIITTNYNNTAYNMNVMKNKNNINAKLQREKDIARMEKTQNRDKSKFGTRSLADHMSGIMSPIPQESNNNALPSLMHLGETSPDHIGLGEAMDTNADEMLSPMQHIDYKYDKHKQFLREDQAHLNSPKQYKPQPPYDHSAAMRALRLAKESMKADFSQFWEWGKKGGTDSNSNSNSISKSSNAPSKAPMSSPRSPRVANATNKQAKNSGNNGKDNNTREEDIMNKVERVKKMQMLYSQKGAGGASGANMAGLVQTGNIAPDYAKSGTETGQSVLHTAGRAIAMIDNQSPARKPGTPKINDMNLTDQDLMMISKYFKDDAQAFTENMELPPQYMAIGGLPALSNHNVPHFVQPIRISSMGNENGITMTDEIDTSRSILSEAIQESRETSRRNSVNGLTGHVDMMELIQDNNENSNVGDNQLEEEQAAHTKLTALVTSHETDNGYIPTPEGSPSGMMDELYGGGNLDSLLKWSSNLDVEM